MPDSTVPEIYAPALKHLVAIPDEQFGVLLEATDKIGRPSGIGGYLEFAESVGIEGDKAALLVQALLSMMAFAESQDADLADMVEVIASSDDLGLSGPDSALLADRIKRLFEHGPITALQKSFALSVLHDRLFLSAQITTDIRPVFGGDVNNEMAAAVVSHSLKIDFSQSGGSDSFYVTLDPSDLMELQQAMERATSKADSIATTLEKAGIANLTWSG